MVEIFVMDFPEFAPIVQDARRQGYQVEGPTEGLWSISAPSKLRFNRKEAGLSAALWNTVLGPGVVGCVTKFDRFEFAVSEV